MEQENAQLKAAINNLKETHTEAIANLTKRFNAAESAHATEIASLTQQMANIQLLLKAIPGMTPTYAPMMGMPPPHHQVYPYPQMFQIPPAASLEKPPQPAAPNPTPTPVPRASAAPAYWKNVMLGDRTRLDY